MESFLYKNFLKDYEIALEKENERFKKINKKVKILARKAHKNADEFIDMLLNILNDAQDKEKEFVSGGAERPEMDQEHRKRLRTKVYSWFKDMERNDDFGKENVEKIKLWLMRHERIFGTEFEERYDPYVIIIKLADIK